MVLMAPTTPTAKCMYCGEAIYKVTNHWGSCAGHWKHVDSDRWGCAPSGDGQYHVADNAKDPNPDSTKVVVVDLSKVEEEFLTKSREQVPRKTCKPTTVLVLEIGRAHV